MGTTTTSTLEYGRIETADAPAKLRFTKPSIGQAGIKKLAESIDRMGLLQPLVVRMIKVHNPEPGQPHRRYILIDGLRRYTALGHLIAEGKFDPDRIPVTNWKGPKEEVSLASLAANIDRESLTEAEICHALVQLSDSGYEVDVLSERFDRQRNWVYNRIQIGKRAIDAVRDALHEDEITFTEALKLSRLPDSKQSETLDALKALTGGDEKRIDQLTFHAVPQPEEKKSPGRKLKKNTEERKRLVDGGTGKLPRPGVRQMKLLLKMVVDSPEREQVVQGFKMGIKFALGHTPIDEVKKELGID